MHRELSGRNLLLKEMDKMQQQLAGVMSDDKLTISEKCVNTKEVTELLDMVKIFVNMEIDDEAENRKQMMKDKKMTPLTRRENQTRHVLLIKRDQFGNFYQFENLRGKKKKRISEGFDNSARTFREFYGVDTRFIESSGFTFEEMSAECMLFYKFIGVIVMALSVFELLSIGVCSISGVS